SDDRLFSENPPSLRPMEIALSDMDPLRSHLKRDIHPIIDDKRNAKGTKNLSGFLRKGDKLRVRTVLFPHLHQGDPTANGVQKKALHLAFRSEGRIHHQVKAKVGRGPCHFTTDKRSRPVKSSGF